MRNALALVFLALIAFAGCGKGQGSKATTKKILSTDTSAFPVTVTNPKTGKTWTILGIMTDGHDFGQAKITCNGAELVISVRCDAQDKFSRDDQGLVIDYDDERQAYIIEPLPDSLKKQLKEANKISVLFVLLLSSERVQLNRRSLNRRSQTSTGLDQLCPTKNT